MTEDNSETSKVETIQSNEKHSGFSRMLNKYFHHIDRGGSLKSEVTAGILICILAVCGIFMNMQLISSMLVSGTYSASTSTQVAANGEIIAATWFISMLVAFIGSMLIGLVARLPFVQVSGLGLSTVLISLIGASNGLTYYNLLAISFISSIVYTVLFGVPFIRDKIKAAIPAVIKTAVPIAFGLLLILIALQLSGIITIEGSALSAYGIGTELASSSDTVGLISFLGISLFSYSTDSNHPLLLIGFLMAILAIVLVFVFKSRKAKHPYLWSLLISQVGFLLLQLLFVAINWEQMDISVTTFLGRAWMIGSEDAYQLHLSSVFSNLSIGAVFTEGFDFSAYSGNVVLLFLTGILTMLYATYFTSNATANATLTAAGVDKNDTKYSKLSYVCNGGMNIVAPVLGVSPVSIGAESVAGAGDNAKSGIASVVASIGFLISMFVWVIPAVFVTNMSSSIQMNLYGHYGVVMQLLTECSFGVADAVMAAVGFMIIKNALPAIDWKDAETVITVMVVVIGTLITSNIAYGVAAGAVEYTAYKMLAKPADGVKKIDALKNIGISTYVFAGISLLLIIFALFL